MNVLFYTDHHRDIYSRPLLDKLRGKPIGSTFEYYPIHLKNMRERKLLALLGITEVPTILVAGGRKLVGDDAVNWVLQQDDPPENEGDPDPNEIAELALLSERRKLSWVHLLYLKVKLLCEHSNESDLSKNL